AVADLAERARVLSLHPRRVPAVLRDTGVVDDPGDNADLRRNALGAATHEQCRIPGRVGEKLLHRLVPRRRLLEPKQGRLQALPPALLDQPTRVQKRVFALHTQRERLRHPLDKHSQPVAHLDRWRLQRNRYRHPLLPSTMTATADTVRGERTGPFTELTKSY